MAARAARTAFAVAALAAVLAALLAPTGLAAAVPAQKPTGFDHRLHDRDVVVGGGDPLPCARCHPMAAGALIGKPGHAACFGSCHGAAPRAVRAEDRSGERRAVCTSCHAEAALAVPAPRTLPVAYPPYTIDPDFAITVGHRRHREVACTQCHGGGRSAPHRRCASCHDGSGAPGRGPAMTACIGCHAPAVGAALPPSIVPSEVNVAAVFARDEHARHAARGAAGARCTTCHAALLDTDDNVLPAPDDRTCAAARCHDGTQAFAITAACTRCHVDPRLPGFKVERPTARFSHAGHAERAGAGARVQPCATCHPLSPSGEVITVGHAPCAPCHADDFGRRQPTICGACHNGTEPWRQLVADRGPAERTEFGATLDHARHASSCTSCHALTTAARQLRPPRGHRACTGTACHAVTAGPAPRLGACEACHRLGLSDARQRARLAAPWSVRATFDHAAHAESRAIECAACHVDLRAGDVTQLATPPKATCAPCHDGRAAFKLTGTTCTRCHQGAQR